MRALIRTGARLFIGGELLSLMLALGGFDDCGGTPIEFPDASSFRCGDTVCAEYVAEGSCVARFECRADLATGCAAVEMRPGRDDGNECTIDTCEGGEWIHRTPTAAEIDDGDPCTVDSCDWQFGIVHSYSCSATCQKEGC